MEKASRGQLRAVLGRSVFSTTECSDLHIRMIHLRQANKRNSDLEAFRQLQTQDLFTDMTIVAKSGPKLSVHSLVVCANSKLIKPWMEATFVPDLQYTIILPDVEYKTAQALCQFLYGQNLSISHHQFSKVHQLAEVLGIALDVNHGDIVETGSILSALPAAENPAEIPSHQPPVETIEHQNDESDIIEPVPKPSSMPICCWHCNKPFPSLDDLQVHVNERHKGEAVKNKRHKCQKCKKILPSMWKLRQHLLTHKLAASNRVSDRQDHLYAESSVSSPKQVPASRGDHIYAGALKETVDSSNLDIGSTKQSSDYYESVKPKSDHTYTETNSDPFESTVSKPDIDHLYAESPRPETGRPETRRNVKSKRLSQKKVEPTLETTRVAQIESDQRRSVISDHLYSFSQKVRDKKRKIIASPSTVKVTKMQPRKPLENEKKKPVREIPLSNKPDPHPQSAKHHTTPAQSPIVATPAQSALLIKPTQSALPIKPTQTALPPTSAQSALAAKPAQSALAAPPAQSALAATPTQSVLLAQSALITTPIQFVLSDAPAININTDHMYATCASKNESPALPSTASTISHPKLAFVGPVNPDWYAHLSSIKQEQTLSNLPTPDHAYSSVPNDSFDNEDQPLASQKDVRKTQKRALKKKENPASKKKMSTEVSFQALGHSYAAEAVVRTKNNKKKSLQAKSFACDQCGRIFPQLYRKNRHIREVHMKERKHVCRFCDKSFFKVTSMERHELVHVVHNNWICPNRTCSKNFCDPSALKYHIDHKVCHRDRKKIAENTTSGIKSLSKKKV